jgi:hypothetical protein
VTLKGGTLSQDRTWDFSGLPVHLTGSLSISSATLTIVPGTVVKMPEGSYFSVYNAAAALDAQGTASEPIIFTSVEDDSAGGDSNGDGAATAAGPGQWQAVFVNSGKATLDNVEIRYAGNEVRPGYSGRSTASVQITASAVLRNVIIRDVESTGVSISGAVSPTLSGVSVFRAAEAWPITRRWHPARCTPT